MRVLNDDSGFGMIYEAYERTTPKILKVLKDRHNNHPKAVQLFRQEAEVLGRFNHPGIPRVGPEGCFLYFPKDSSGPLHCFVMEKIDGPNLMQWMQQQGNQPISEWQALNWLKQLADILHLVHQHHYFHRDIKPQNIMLRSTGELVLVDFGTVREMTLTYLEKVGEFGGITQISSPGYTPPEQEHGQAVPQSDFYALGRTFVYLLTGMQLTGSSLYDPIMDKFHWREYAPTVSPQLADLIDRLISPRVVDRPQDSQELLFEIANLYNQVSDRHSASRPRGSFAPTVTLNRTVASPTELESIRLESIRKKGLLAGAIALVLVLAGGGGWLAYRTMVSEVKPSAIATARTLTGHSSYINAIALSPDGKTLATGSADKTIKLWDFNTEKELQTLTGHTSFVNTVLFSPDGTTLISGSADRTIKLWNLATGQAIRTLIGHTSFIRPLAITQDGQILISGSADRTIRFWNLTTGKPIRLLTGHTGFINSLVITPDGSTLISGSADRTIKFWNIATGKEILSLNGHLDFVNALAITPDGRTLVSGSADKTIRLWDFTTGKPLRSLTGHQGYVNALTISPDGRKLASASADKTIRLWDLATGNEIRAIGGYPHPLNFFLVTPDWQTIATGSGDRVVRIWGL
jgi:WD40 repeat protein